jgi:hypothetical protein
MRRAVTSMTSLKKRGFGKCKEMSTALVDADPSLALVRGYYYCSALGKLPHWWTKRPDGTIVDPTKDQFPSKGTGRYVEFDGFVECSECGKKIKEEDADLDGEHAFCSGECYGRFVGVL